MKIAIINIYLKSSEGIMKLLIWLMVFLGMLLFTGVFGSETTTIHKLIMTFLCLLYVTAPTYINNNHRFGIDLNDRRNGIILAFAGLMGIFSINYSLPFGIITIEMGISILFSVFVFYSAILLVKPNNSNTGTEKITSMNQLD
jgi:hypothetical protein